MSASTPLATFISPTRSTTASAASMRAPASSPPSPAMATPAMPALAAAFNEPYGIAVDRSGNIYVADRHNHCVRRVDGASGVVTTFAGNGASGYAGDGGAAARAGL